MYACSSDSEDEHIARYMSVSSANNRTRDLTRSGWSFVYARNNMGPRIESFRTPDAILKKGKRKVQGMPQSQTAALPRHQEEGETDKSKQAQIEQTYEKH